MAGIDPLVWKNYNPETGQGDPSTPLTAETLNQWTSDIVLVSDTAEAAAIAAQQAAQDAVAPTDTMIANALGTPGSEARAVADGLYQGSLGVVTPEMFGAVGDGSTDDTVAWQAFVDHLAANGGTGLVPPGTYRITDTISLGHVVASPKPTHGFTITGAGRTSIIELDTTEVASPKSIFAMRGLFDTTIERLRLVATNEPAGHGISASYPVNLTIADVDVRNFVYTGIICHGPTVGVDPQPINNKILRCNVYGEGVGSNGVLFSSNHESVMEDCNVYDLDLSSSPVFGLQLKNNCLNCTIRGGIVDTAKAGVAFGSDHETTNAGHKVTGVTVRNCNNGFIASKTINTEVDLMVDMEGRDTGLEPVRIIGGCSNLVVTATVDNIHPSATAAHIASDDCEVNITRMNQLGTFMARFEAGITTSVLRSSLPPDDVSVSRGAGAVATVVLDRVGPFAMQAGSVDVSLAATSGATEAISFTPGRFLEAPIVTATIASTGGSAQKCHVRVGLVSTTGATVAVNTGDGTAATTTVPVMWQAVQMLHGSAAG